MAAAAAVVRACPLNKTSNDCIDAYRRRMISSSESSSGTACAARNATSTVPTAPPTPRLCRLSDSCCRCCCCCGSSTPPPPIRGIRNTTGTACHLNAALTVVAHCCYCGGGGVASSLCRRQEDEDSCAAAAADDTPNATTTATKLVGTTGTASHSPSRDAGGGGGGPSSRTTSSSSTIQQQREAAESSPLVWIGAELVRFLDKMVTMRCDDDPGGGGSRCPRKAPPPPSPIGVPIDPTKLYTALDAVAAVRGASTDAVAGSMRTLAAHKMGDAVTTLIAILQALASVEEEDDDESAATRSKLPSSGRHSRGGTRRDSDNQSDRGGRTLEHLKGGLSRSVLTGVVASRRHHPLGRRRREDEGDDSSDNIANSEVMRSATKILSLRPLPNPFPVAMLEDIDGEVADELPNSQRNTTTPSRRHRVALREILARAFLGHERIHGYTWDGDDDADPSAAAGTGSNSSSCTNATATWTTTKRLHVARFPPVQMLHLKRFRRETSTGAAATSVLVPCDPTIQIPATLDLNEFVSNDPSAVSDTAAITSVDDGSDTDYVLTGGLLHLSDEPGFDLSHGDDDNDTDGGHCMAVVLRGNDWFLVDDDRVVRVSENQVLLWLGGDWFFGTDGGDPVQRNQSPTPSDTEKQGYVRGMLLVYRCKNQRIRVHPEVMNEHADESTATAFCDGGAEPTTWIGRRLRVQWSKGKFYVGTVSGYDRITGKHTVRYDDGDIRTYNLQKKNLEWIGTSTSCFPGGGPPPAAADADGQPMPTAGSTTKNYGPECVGRRLKVGWKHGIWYEGSVAAFDARTGKHSVLYDDGDVRDYCLAKKRLEWLIDA
jgi:Ubiquitin carboxyl-terminal hydrolase